MKQEMTYKKYRHTEKRDSKMQLYVACKRQVKVNKKLRMHIKCQTIFAKLLE